MIPTPESTGAVDTRQAGEDNNPTLVNVKPAAGERGLL